MATIRGHEGILRLGGGSGSTLDASNNVLNLTSYTLDTTQDTIETTAMGGTRSRTFTKGLMTYTGSADFQYDGTTPQDGAITPLNIFTDSNDVGTVELFPEAADSGDIKVSGDVIVTGYSLTAAVDGIVTGSITFQGTGAVTYGTV